MFAYIPTEIREAFRVLDRDGNGFISKQELGMAMRSLGYMPSEVELAIIMQRLDMDGKNTLITMFIVRACVWMCVRESKIPLIYQK